MCYLKYLRIDKEEDNFINIINLIIFFFTLMKEIDNY